MSLDRLQERVRQDGHFHQATRLSVGLVKGDTEEHVVLDRERELAHGAADELRVPVACIAKVFTAALLVEELEARGITLSSNVASVLATKAGLERDTLAQISLRQLLNHTHGLDGSSLAAIPRLSCGRIDARALCEELSNGPAIGEPGEWYSYGNVGPWLAAAVIECLCDQAYEDVLAERILDKIGVPLAHADRRAATVCPATGGELALAVRHFLSFIKTHLAARCSADPLRASADRLDVMPGASVAMPGWCLERGAGVGWKYFGGGWYGYDGVTRTASVRVRLRFEDRIGIVVIAEGGGAGIALARLFGRAYPELRPSSLPRAVNDGRRPDASVARACAGDYVNRARLVRVTVGEGASMRFVSSELRGGPGEVAEAVLKPYIGTLYIPLLQAPRIGASRLPPVVEFVGKTERLTHLWNGSELLRRV